MKVLVVGASRGSGAAVVRELAGRGHTVTAFSRSGAGELDGVPGVVSVQGDAMDGDALAGAVSGQDAVVVTLGISDNPVGVRLRRRATTPLDIRSSGTRRIVAAMEAAGVDRLVVQTTYGIGDTFRRLSLGLKVFFVAVIRPQVADSARQEDAVRSSGLAWTLVRPVVLHDDEDDAPAHVRTDDTVGSMRVSRAQVARVLADQVERGDVHRTLSVSAA